jgi:hypothetical protein
MTRKQGSEEPDPEPSRFQYKSSKDDWPVEFRAADNASISRPFKRCRIMSISLPCWFHARASWCEMNGRYSHVFEKFWDVLEKPLVHPEAADESDFTKACMSVSDFTKACMSVSDFTKACLSLTAPLVDSEAPEWCQIVAKQAAVSRLCMVQDAPDKWAEMVDRSSPGSDGPASLCGSGAGTDLVPRLGLMDTCVPSWHPSQT